jgi:hypothetical protein
VLTAVLVIWRRRRRTVELVAHDDESEFEEAVWGRGDEWPRIIVRSHGRLRDVSPSPRRVEAVAIPTPTPWEPPRAS